MYLDNDILVCDVAKNDGLLHVRLCPKARYFNETAQISK